MNKRKRVVVIGAGAIGLSTAYYLNKSGHEVIVLDNSPQVSNCSYGNAGMVVPSHFIPLAAPGVVWQGLKWLLNPESPFSIKPSLNFQLLAWMFHFYKASNTKHVEKTMNLLYQLNRASSKLFKELNKELDFDFESKGLVILANSKKGMQHEVENLDLSKKMGQSAELLTVKDAKYLLKQEQLNIQGAVHYKEDGHLNPASFMTNMIEKLEKAGVIFYDAEVEKLKVDKSTITGLETNKEFVEAEEYVLSAGAWSAKLLENLGINLLLAPGKGYSYTLPHPSRQIGLPTILAEGKVAITPFKDTLRFAGTMEIGSFDLSVNKKRVNGLIKTVNNYLPEYSANDFKGLSCWSGLRPVSFDGLPFIGKLKKYPNLTIATGHSMMGISLAPITGKLVDDIICKREISYNMGLLSPVRN